MMRMPNETLARRATFAETRAGRIPRARELACADCAGPAEQYDHYLGYEPENWLSVQPVCQTCHTAREVARGKFKKPQSALPTHGTASTYSNWDCRCDPCRAANTAKSRERRQRGAA